METNVERIVKECEGPKFLAHYVCPWKSKDRHDLSIYEALKRGEEIKYEATRTEGTGTDVPFPGGEFAFSVWPWKLHGEALGWGEGRQGLIIFSPKFYDKICNWDVPEEELMSLYDNLRNIRTIGGMTYEQYVSMLHEKEMRETRIGIEKFKEDWHDDEAYRNLLERLEKRREEGPRYDREEYSKFYSWYGGMALESIIALRHGLPDWSITDKLDPELLKKITIDRRGPEYCAHEARKGDYGVRAVKLTPEKDLVALDISREDVKYLISWGDNEAEPRVLIKPQ
ncbi:hypothetical protein KY308_00935 [Candidatus Woesearchaeota archaeon]|nr:hypothetical protein [Candidatus Woesearchaeota archaeon]